MSAADRAQSYCAECKHATAKRYMGVATGYFTCALQKAWLLRTACNINQFQRAG